MEDAFARELRTPRLNLKVYVPEMAQTFTTLVAESQAHLARFMPFAVETPDVESYAEIFEKFGEGHAEGDCTYGIFTHDGQAVGGGGVHPKVGPLGVEIGYWIAKPALRQGYATEALAAFCHEAFARDDVDRVQLHIEPHNAASIALAKKAGFSFEGNLRRRLPWPNEAPRDIALYTLFREDWPSSSGARVEVERLAIGGP